jgi:hypothetical protein
VPILVGNAPPVDPEDPGDPVVPAVRDEPTLIWSGWTGDEWVLAGDRNAGTFIERDGLGGLLEPTIQYYLSENTGDGSNYRGHRYPAREVTVPIFIWAATPSEMRAEDAKFRRTLRPEHEVTLTVAEPDGRRRYLGIKYLSGAEGAFSGSTYGKHWMRYTLTLTALDPFFYGETVTRTFAGDTPVDFFNDGEAPPFYISEADTIATATVTNEGDEPTYADWFIHGAMTSFTGGWAGAVITLPITLSTAQSVTVVTDPRVGTIIDQNGTNRWGDVIDADIHFGPLPAGVATELGITVEDGDANTSVQLSWRPKYRSAW